MTTKKQQAINDQRINRIFSIYLKDTAVLIGDLDRICRAGEEKLLSGCTDEEIGKAMLAELAAKGAL